MILLDHNMKKRKLVNWRPTWTSKRIIRKAKIQKNNNKKNNAILCPSKKSKRIILNHQKNTSRTVCDDRHDMPGSSKNVQTNQHGRQLWSHQIIKLPTELYCADISRDLNHRLGLKSCYCCDNFRSDRIFLPPDTKQETASIKKYQCKRTQNNLIKVSVSY